MLWLRFFRSRLTTFKRTRFGVYLGFLHFTLQTPSNHDQRLNAKLRSNSAGKNLSGKSYNDQRCSALIIQKRHYLTRWLKRDRRSWTMDDFWALFSWLFIGQGLFVLIGTTTFASLVLLLANSLQFNEFLAKRVGSWLSHSTGGIQVIFGGGAEPNWRDGRITFRQVRIVCGDNLATNLDADNYTRFDVTVDRLDLSISLKRYLEGRGLAERITLAGVRGLLDRRKVRPVPDWRYQPQPGDFDLEALQIRNLLVTIIGPEPIDRPVPLSILHADVGRLRKSHLLLDLLHAESIIGMFDGSLFSMHIPQGQNMHQQEAPQMRHLKIDGLQVEHFALGAQGPLGWLRRGTVDVDAFVQLPHQPNTFSSIEARPREVDSILFQDRIGELLPGDLWERLVQRWHEHVTSHLDFPRKSHKPATLIETFQLPSCLPDQVAWRVNLRFRNIRADIPFPTPHLSYLSGALIRPIVGYINEHRPYIPLSVAFVIPSAAFTGAWTIWEPGIADAMARETAVALTALVEDRSKRLRRLKRVGLWSLISAVKQLGSLLERHNSSIWSAA